MYATYFGFKQIPFNTQLHPADFFYGVSARTNELALIQAIRNQSRVMFLCGDPGVGKTALLRKLAQDLSRAHRFLFPKREGSRIEQIVDCLADAVGLNPGPLTLRQKFEKLREIFTDSDRLPANPVLVIDDADELSPAAMDQLSVLTRIHKSGASALQIVFAGCVALRARIEESGLGNIDSTETFWYHLKGLTDQEVRCFIQQRLDRSGYRGGPLFSDRAIERITEYSEGNFAKVGVLCGFSLLSASIDNQKSVSEKIVVEEASRCLFNAEHNTVDETTFAFRDEVTQQSRNNQPDHLIMEDVVTKRYLELGIPKPYLGIGNGGHSDSPECGGFRTRLRSWIDGFGAAGRYAYISLFGILLISVMLRSADLSSWNGPFDAEMVNSEQSTEDLPASIGDGISSKEERSADARDAAIQSMLRKAEAQIAAQRFFAPEGDNALETYQEIGVLIERQMKTLNKMLQIKHSYQRWGREAELRGDWPGAEKFYTKAFGLSPYEKDLSVSIERIRDQWSSGAESTPIKADHPDLSQVETKKTELESRSRT